MPLALYIGLIFSNFILLDEIKSTGTYFVRGLLINLDNNTKLLKTEKTYLHNLFFVSSNNWDNNVHEISHIASIGSVQYSIYGLWLIISSLVLLLALFGTISIVINKDYSEIRNLQHPYKLESSVLPSWCFTLEGILALIVSTIILGIFPSETMHILNFSFSSLISKSSYEFAIFICPLFFINAPYRDWKKEKWNIFPFFP